MLTDGQITELIERAWKITGSASEKSTLSPNAFTEAFKTALDYLIDEEHAKTQNPGGDQFPSMYHDTLPRIYGPGAPGMPVDPMAQAEAAGMVMQEHLRAQGIKATFVPIGFNPFEPRNAAQPNTRVVGPIPKTEEPKGPSGPLTDQEKKDLLNE